jgi:hypothetical protein
VSMDVSITIASLIALMHRRYQTQCAHDKASTIECIVVEQHS